MIRDGPETIAAWAFSVSPLSTIATTALQERQCAGAAAMLFFAVFTAEISGGVAVIPTQRFRKSEEICGRALASSLVLS
jgi:hypothetical protein